jgi:hypothetical protein
MTHVYYKEAAGACLVFDISSSKSFQAAERWKQDINSKVTLPNGEPVPTILFANKCDLDPAEHQVSDSDINKFCSDNSCIAWWFAFLSFLPSFLPVFIFRNCTTDPLRFRMKTSAKDNINIDKGMKLLLSKMVSNPVAVTKTAPLELHLNSPASESPTLQEPQKRCC